jgi:hypothetical protein
VWRHSCNPIGRSPASHARSARFLTVDGTNGSHALRPSARSSPERPVASRCSSRYWRSRASSGTVRVLVSDLGSISPSYWSQLPSTRIVLAPRSIAEQRSACSSPSLSRRRTQSPASLRSRSERQARSGPHSRRREPAARFTYVVGHLRISAGLPEPSDQSSEKKGASASAADPGWSSGRKWPAFATGTRRASGIASARRRPNSGASQPSCSPQSTSVGVRIFP